MIYECISEVEPTRSSTRVSVFGAKLLRSTDKLPHWNCSRSSPPYCYSLVSFLSKAMSLRGRASTQANADTSLNCPSRAGLYCINPLPCPSKRHRKSSVLPESTVMHQSESSSPTQYMQTYTSVLQGMPETSQSAQTRSGWTYFICFPHQRLLKTNKLSMAKPTPQELIRNRRVRKWQTQRRYNPTDTSTNRFKKSPIPYQLSAELT